MKKINVIFKSKTHKIESAGVKSVNPYLLNITRGQFKLRMTQTERIAVRQLAVSDSIVYDFMDLLSDIEIVPLDQPEVIDGINYCSSLGAFSKERADEILGNN